MYTVHSPYFLRLKFQRGHQCYPHCWAGPSVNSASAWSWTSWRVIVRVFHIDRPGLPAVSPLTRELVEEDCWYGATALVPTIMIFYERIGSSLRLSDRAGVLALDCWVYVEALCCCVELGVVFESSCWLASDVSIGRFTFKGLCRVLLHKEHLGRRTCLVLVVGTWYFPSTN